MRGGNHHAHSERGEQGECVEFAAHHSAALEVSSGEGHRPGGGEQRPAFQERGDGGCGEEPAERGFGILPESVGGESGGDDEQRDGRPMQKRAPPLRDEQVREQNRQRRSEQKYLG